MIGAPARFWAPRAPRAMVLAPPGGRFAWSAGSMQEPHQSPLSPLTPQDKGYAPVGQGKGVGRAAAIGFLSKGWRGGCEKPVDSVDRHYANPDSTKRSGRFAILKPPRVGLFLPRVGPFFPRVHFWPIRPVPPLFFFFFRGEREGKRGAKGRAGPSTGLKSVTKVYPRVGDPIHGLSVDENLSNLQWRQPLTAD